MTRVLMLSTDANIFDETSDVRERMKWYGTVFEELHIIVCTTKLKVKSEKLKVSENVFAYSALSALRFLCLWEAYRIAKNIIQTINYQLSTTNCVVITTQDPFEVGLVGYALKRRFGVPLQLQVHTDFLSPYFWRESLKNKIRVLLARFLIPRADGIRVVSERIKNQLKTKNYKLKTDPVVLPIFVDIEQIRATIITTDLHEKYLQFDFIILMASRLTREKNIPMALSAMMSLIRANRRTGLIVVGNGPEKEKLKVKSEKLRVDSNVIFEPAVGFETLVSYYKTADVFLLTSNYEGYGRTVIEAFAAGCPVVMTDVGIAGEIVVDQKNGLVVPVGDVLALTQALVIVYKDEAFRKTFIELRDKARYIKNYHDAVEKLIH